MDKGSSVIKKAVFPAAGVGTRFLPATKAIPKEMLPLVDKPLIQYGVEEVVQSGIKDVIIITSRGKSAIEDHFDISVELEMVLREKGKHDTLKEIREISELTRITYTRQKQPLGLGHAVLCAKNLVGIEPFAVVLGDDIIDSAKPVIGQMIDVYKEFPYSILAVERVPREEIYRYGVIKGEKVREGLYRVSGLVEKPSPHKAPSDLAIIGRYILNPGIFEALEMTEPGRGGEIQLTDAISKLLDREPVYAYEFEGIRYDAGDKLGFIKANIVYALKREGMNASLRAFIKEIL